MQQRPRGYPEVDDPALPTAWFADGPEEGTSRDRRECVLCQTYWSVRCWRCKVELCYGHAYQGALGYACLRLQCLHSGRPGAAHVAGLPEVCATRTEECAVGRYRCVHCGTGVCYECGGRGAEVTLGGDTRVRYQCSEHPCPAVVAGLRRGEQREEAERAEREARDRLPLGRPATVNNNLGGGLPLGRRRVFLRPDPLKGKGKDDAP